MSGFHCRARSQLYRCLSCAVSPATPPRPRDQGSPLCEGTSVPPIPPRTHCLPRQCVLKPSLVARFAILCKSEGLGAIALLVRLRFGLLPFVFLLSRGRHEIARSSKHRCWNVYYT